MACFYDCAHEPARLEPDTDISGLGVVVSYVAAAGIVVIILVGNYLFAYDPAVDFFDQDRDHQGQAGHRGYRPNRIDVIVLRAVRYVKFRPRGTSNAESDTTRSTSDAVTPPNGPMQQARIPIDSTRPVGGSTSLASREAPPITQPATHAVGLVAPVQLANLIRQPANDVSQTHSPVPQPETYHAQPISSTTGTVSPVTSLRCQSRWQKALSKCVLAMSDLQILTGMSILISGYLQLKCGISCYHWQMIVGLAWFATITNFGCLSFLRRHLYNHQGERTLRLLGMGCIVTMLIVALVPTANYAWLHSSSGHSNASSYAICHFVYGPEEDSNSDIYSVLGRLNAALSIVLLAVASICRIILLHKYLSRRILGKWRTKASIYARSKLLALWIKWEIQSNTNVFQRHLLYHPLLACFLTIRILSDLIASMFFEIWWLVVSYIIGVRRVDSLLKYYDNGPTRWSFGQVVPLMLLTAPLLTVFELLFSEDEANHLNASSAVITPASSLEDNSPSPSPPSRTPTTQMAAAAVETAIDGVNDHPDHDFTTRSPAYLIAEIIAVFIVIKYSGWILAFPSGTGTIILRMSTPYIGFSILSWAPLHISLCLTHSILWGFLIEGTLSAFLRKISPIQYYVLFFYVALIDAFDLTGVGGYMMLGLVGGYWASAVCLCLVTQCS